MKEKLVIFMIYMVFLGGVLAKLLQHLIRWHSVLIMLAATIHFVLIWSRLKSNGAYEI